jgi:hypothetical protein
MTLAEQLAHLRQLAITDPDTSVLDRDLINTLAELAEVLEEVRDGEPWRGFGAVYRGPGAAAPGWPASSSP